MPDARRKRLTLAACVIASFVVFLDMSVVNIALPALRRDLGGGLAGQQWVVEGYLLTLGSLLLVGGSLGDLYGRRRVFALGTVAFGLTSLLCALAPSIGFLVAGRALQGVAGALLVPGSLVLITATFPGAEHGRAVGAWTAWTGIAFVIGPLAGGSLIDELSWRWIFAINVPAVAVVLALVRMAVAESSGRGSRSLDLRGAVLCALGLGGPGFALIQQPASGWGAAEVALPLAAGLALFGLFLVHERRTADPMLPLALFRRRNFAVANLATLAVYAGLSGFSFFLVIFLQQTAGYSALEAGLALLPVTVVMFVASRRFGALADRIGPRLPMGAGPLVATAGLVMLLGVDETPSYATALLPGVTVFGVGLSMTVAPLTATVLAAAGERHAGIASGTNNAIARVAGLLAIAGIGAAVASQSATGASADALHLAVLLSAALVAAGGVVSAIGIENPGAGEGSGAAPPPGG